MIDIFTQSFLGMWKSLPTARVRLRRNGQIIEKAISREIDHSRERTEQGQFEDANVGVRFMASDESQIAPMRLDALVELEIYGTNNWRRYRISGRREQAGMIVLTLDNPNE